MINDEIDDRYAIKDKETRKPLIVKIAFEDGEVVQYSFPENIPDDRSIVGGEWISLPVHTNDEESKWVFNQLGHLAFGRE